MAWEQQDSQKLTSNMSIPYILMWSTRGKCVPVNNITTAKELNGKRWTYLNSEEKKRFKAGDYSPVYDLGLELSRKLQEIGSNEIIRPSFASDEITPIWT